MSEIRTTPEITAALAQGAPVAFGVSGGKDSDAMVLETSAYLDAMGHDGPRILIHSDLGRVEWAQSLPQCERLAAHVGRELVVVRRQAGDLLDRWQARWAANVERYAKLACVKLILPWSTPSMRFCTSELKTAIICRALVRRFSGQTIISASGIRRQESPSRAKAPIAKAQPKLTSATQRTSGYDWHPIIDYDLAQVRATHQRHKFALHEAYTRYGTSRVSCTFCILASRADLVASATCTDNHEIYREMVDLEIASTFRFQDAGWLGDVAPTLLSDAQRDGLASAKLRATQREAVEARIPAHLLYTKGWPTAMPTYAEATLLSEVRREVGAIMGFPVAYTDAYSVWSRYAELLLAQGIVDRGSWHESY